MDFPPFSLNMRFTTLIILLFATSVFAKEMKVHVFNHYRGGNLRHMEMIGRVISQGKITNRDYKKILHYDAREKTVTARIYKQNSIRLGDKIYIIKKDSSYKQYKDGYIIAEGEVYSIFKTEFQGWLMKAKGFFSHVVSGYYIAVDIDKESRNQAYVLLRKGDRSFFLKNYAEALSFYQNSLESDPSKPETYLKLASLSKQLDLNTKSDNYIREAWKRLHHFEDTNAFLQLPGIYLAAENKNIQYHTSEKIKQNNCSHVKTENKFVCKSLKQALFVLQEIYRYRKRLFWFQHTLSPETLRLLTQKGVPDYEFQYNFAQLLLTIQQILHDYFPKDIIFWLDKKERSVLYTKISLPHREKKLVEPKKIWDEAYLQGVLYHLELAHELNPIDPRAAIKIVQLCYDKLLTRPPRLKRETYINIAESYGRTLSNLYQLKGYNWSSVRSILKKISQF